MSTDQASGIQTRMYNFIVTYIRREGMPPTNREIGRELQIASDGIPSTKKIGVGDYRD